MTTLDERRVDPLLRALVEELERLPASRLAAVQVLRLVDDDDSSAAQVATAAAADPALTARLLRLANSAYYGLSGRVGSSAFAVSVVGFTTVRSLAAVAAAGLGGADALPPGFWDRAAAVASGAALVAPRVGAPEADAFCAGLLHDLGSALLRQRDRARHDRVLAHAARDGDLRRAEVRGYGDTSTSLCAKVLRSWQFPAGLCHAVEHARRPPDPVDPPLQRALQAGLALSELGPGGPTPAQQAALTLARVRRPEVAGLVAAVTEARQQLGTALGA